MRILLNFLLLLLASALACGRDPLVDRELGVAFPESIASLTFEGKQQYNGPKLGYSLRYQNEDLVKADIYVYDKGYTDIKEGVSSKRVQEEFAEVINVFPDMERTGKYRGVKELAKQTKSYGEQRREYLWARYEYQQAPGEGVLYYGDRISEIYITAARGKFIKVRITVKKDDLNKWEDIFDRFMEGVTRLLETNASP